MHYQNLTKILSTKYHFSFDEIVSIIVIFINHEDCSLFSLCFDCYIKVALYKY